MVMDISFVRVRALKAMFRVYNIPLLGQNQLMSFIERNVNTSRLALNAPHTWKLKSVMWTVDQKSHL